MGKMKKILRILTVITLINLLISTNLVFADQLQGTPSGTAGVTLYTAGLSAGTVAEPTGEAGGEPTDDVVEEAVLAGVLELIGDQTEEVISFMSGPSEPYENGRDTTLNEVVEGLEAIDDFGLVEEGGDPASNYDAGINGWVRLGNFGKIKADGIVNNGTLGFDPSYTAEEQLRGNEIFFYEDAELSGMIISLITWNGNTINITISDRQINPNTTAGADDTLITVDLDTLPGFDSANDAVKEILVVDDGISMAGEYYTTEPSPELPIWGDATLELDAVATLVSALTGEISGYKWNDQDSDGVKDAGEPVLDGWTIEITGDAAATTTTDINGFYDFTELVTGNYTVSEMLKPGWVQTYPSSPGSHQIELAPGENSTDNNFGNVRPVGSISGMKWNDTDSDGVKDPGENGLVGWTIYLSGDSSATTTTGSDGSYIFEDLVEGSYTVSEENQLFWTQTHPGGDGKYYINLPAGGSSENNNFGNQYTPPPPSVGGDAEIIEPKTDNNLTQAFALIILTLSAVIITKSYTK
jgi:hypothetical protein